MEAISMKLRAPSIPLITIDPYFSIWSITNELNSGNTVHWTCKPNRMTGILVIDNDEYLFMGARDNTKKMIQAICDINALSTTYTFTYEQIELKLTFTSPLLLDDIKVMSRPVSYLKAEISGADKHSHQIELRLYIADDVCLNQPGESATTGTYIPLDNAVCARMGSKKQNVLSRAGDDVRIDWGYFYLACKAENAKIYIHNENDSTLLEARVPLGANKQKDALFLLAYDDIYSIQYFGKNLKGYWTNESESIEHILQRALIEYTDIKKRCDSFSNELYQSAIESGGIKYAELLMLAYRQVIAAHKLCADTNGEILFISKECFSNGCAATVDVTYPSIPLFLLYNPELIKGMLRPILKYAKTDIWPFEFAPHDAGTYPLLNGQVYSDGTDPSSQMPVEECGNILITVAALSLSEDNFDFAKENLSLLKKWTTYLIKNGSDPEDQLCTDDFAGHLAHNCNLSIKAIMGIASYGIIMENLFGKTESKFFFETAKNMANNWMERASNCDGTFRLTFDRPNTFSMKYNMIWDQIFETGLFPYNKIQKELKSYLSRMNRYGMPLDNRANYTKSDWLVWCGALMSEKNDFEKFIEPLWKAYHESESRVPMTDWYDTTTAKQQGFQHRSVQGGLFIKLLTDKNK